MNTDLATVNTALTVLAAAAVIQLAALVAAVLWVRSAMHRATTALDEVRPVLARLGRAADEVESVAGTIGEMSDDARHLLASVRTVAASVGPVLMPRTWVAGKLINWAAHRRARRLAKKEQTDVEST
jgi:hypothetical protein